MKNLVVFALLVCFFAIGSQAFSQGNAFLMTYGPNAEISEGDDDFKQIIFLQIPATHKDSLYLRIFDADCGGARDVMYGTGWNSETRFRLFGGKGAFSSPTARQPTPSPEAIQAGTLIADETFSVDQFRDDKWYSFTKFAPSKGDSVGGYYYFKLIVEGLNGDDGNLFDIAVSTMSYRNIDPQGVQIFSHAPTIRLPQAGIHAELRLDIPKGTDSIEVHNFDGANADIAVETVFRSNLAVARSGQGNWAFSSVALDDDETGREAAVNFEGGMELPNDATVYVIDNKKNPLAIKLPIYLRARNNRPEPKILRTLLADCKSILFDASATMDKNGDPLSFFWSFGDGDTSSGARVVHKYEKAGSFDGVLIVTDASGQIGNSTKEFFTVAINELPVAKAGADKIGIPGETLTFDAGESSDSDGKIVRYLWDFGDGSRAVGSKVTHAYGVPGFFGVELRVEDNTDAPCNFTLDKAEVWVNASPVVDIGPDIIASPNQTITVTGKNSFDSDGQIIRYTWDMGDGASKPGMVASHSYPKPGKYKVVLVVEDNSGAKNKLASDTLIVTVNDPPIAQIKTDKLVVATDEDIKFDGSTTIERDGKIIYYGWNFGDGGRVDSIKAVHSYARSGRYNVILTVRDNSTSTSDTDTDTLLIIVNYPPAPNAGPDQLVTTSEVKFDGSKSSDFDDRITKYFWEFGDGFTSEEMSPTHVYANPGIYDVTLTVTDDAKTRTSKVSDKMRVVINAAPIADAGPHQIAAPNQKVTFDGSASIDPDGNLAKYTWNFGDGSTGTGEKVTHEYAKPGLYTVFLTVQDNTGHEKAISYDETTVFINTPPVSIAGDDIKAAPGDIITFDGSKSYDIDGKILSARWSFSDNKETSEKITTKRKFDDPGIYTAALTIVDNSGARNAQAQSKVMIHINHQPQANPGKDLHTCDLVVLFDGSASVDADGDKLTYFWDFGDGSAKKSGLKVYHTYDKHGVYPVILTVDDGSRQGNAKHSASMVVSINQPPFANAGQDKTVCAGDVVLFDGGGSTDPEGGLLKYKWDFGDGTSAEGVNPTKTYTKGGAYAVTLQVEDDSGLECNSDVDRIVVQVVEAPVANAGEDQIVCANTEVHFDGALSRDFDGLVNSFLWDFGDGTTGGGSTPTHVFAEPGSYLVTLTITGDNIGNCDNTDTDELMVTVFEAPVAKFTNLPAVPVNEKVEFDASECTSGASKIIQYAWDFGDSTYGQGVKPIHTYTKPGKYFVSMTVTTDSETDCNSTSTRSLIIVNDKPIAEAGIDQYAGINDMLVFNGHESKDSDGKITKYEWDFGDGAKSVGLQVRHRYVEAGKYTVVLRVTDDTQLSNNQDVDSLFVTINSTPTSVIEGKSQACVNEEVKFSGAKSKDPDGIISSYNWVFGDGSTGEGPEVVHAFAQPGTYQVTLAVDDGKKVGNSLVESTFIIKVNRPPFANGGSDRVVCPDEEFTVTGSASYDLDGKITEYHWDFGDGVKGDGKEVVHSYKEPGIYKVSLIVADDSETSCRTGSTQFNVRVNTRPVAVAGNDIETFLGGAHDAVFFDGTMSSDADKDPLTYTWTFGDGTSAKGPKVSHVYTKPGDYIVKLTVSDGLGTKCSESADDLVVKVKKR